MLYARRFWKLPAVLAGQIAVAIPALAGMHSTAFTSGSLHVEHGERLCKEGWLECRNGGIEEGRTLR